MLFGDEFFLLWWILALLRFFIFFLLHFRRILYTSFIFCIVLWLDSLVRCFYEIFKLAWVEYIWIQRIRLAESIRKFFLFGLYLGVVVDSHWSINDWVLLGFSLSLIFVDTFPSFVGKGRHGEGLAKGLGPACVSSYLSSVMASTTIEKKSSFRMTMRMRLPYNL